jgi:hypothetical protein
VKFSRGLNRFKKIEKFNWITEWINLRLNKHFEIWSTIFNRWRKEEKTSFRKNDSQISRSLFYENITSTLKEIDNHSDQFLNEFYKLIQNSNTLIKLNELTHHILINSTEKTPNSSWSKFSTKIVKEKKNWEETEYDLRKQNV